MEDNKKIEKLLERKAKIEEEVKRIHKLIFKEAGTDNAEMRVLRNKYDEVKKQLGEVNERIEQLRQKHEAKTKTVKSENVMSEPVIKEPVIQKESTRIRKITSIGNYNNRNVDKPVKKVTESAQPSVKPIENKVAEKIPEIIEVKDKKEDKEEDKKIEQDIELQNELESKQEEKPKRVQERVKVKGINIRVPQKIEPKPIIPSQILR